MSYKPFHVEMRDELVEKVLELRKMLAVAEAELELFALKCDEDHGDYNSCDRRDWRSHR